jgi:hypothetical protein
MKTFQTFTEEAEVMNLLQLEESEIYALMEADSIRANIARTAAQKLPASQLKKKLLLYATLKYADKNKKKSYKLADTQQGVTKAK